ncbi:hypothetical protein ACFL2J_07810 [Candidatus Omnitrophota bacterium]
MEKLLLQYLALCTYVLFMGFTFCDGFKLHVVRKLAWFAAFLLVAFAVFKTEGNFNLAAILPLPTLLAFL